MNKLFMRYKLIRQEKTEFKKELDRLKKEVISAYSEFKKIFEDNKKYVELNIIQDWQEKNKKLHDEISIALMSQNFKLLVRAYKDHLVMVPKMYKYINKFRRKHNKKVLNIQKNNLGENFFKIEGRHLDKYQINAVLKSDKVSLVIGPGTSGLTYTCVAKAKYMVKSNLCKENEMLILTDTIKHADILSKILSSEKLYVHAKTIEDLCLEILNDFKKTPAEIMDVNMDSFVEEQINKHLKDEIYKKRFVDYYFNHRQAGAVAFEFKKIEDYDKYLEDYPPITINGEKVKNYEHLAVANYLFRNNIDYRYMKEYCVSAQDYEGRKYRPVFYLPDFDIYIEVFEISAVGEAAYKKETSLISKTSSEIYREKMNVIREIHEKNSTVHIEVFSYEKMDMTLFEHLEEKLLNAGAVLAPMHADEVCELILKQNSYLLRELSVILSELMHLSRDNELTWDDILSLNREKNKTFSSSYKGNEIIISLLIPIFEEYIVYLGDKKDMYGITEYTANTIKIMKKDLKYKCIIVDNFENMNRTRANLLKTIWEVIRHKNNSILFCAGNDWQCTSGKNAADFSYISEFSRFFEIPETTYLMNLYQQVQKLYVRNSRFIEKNTAQIRKYAKCKLQSSDEYVECLEYSYKYEEKKDNDTLFDEDEVKIAQNGLKNYVNSLPDEYSVILVGRFIEDIELFKKLANDKIQIKMVYDLDESADVIILVNARKHIIGFPDRTAGDRVRDLFLLKPDFYPFAAERRLWHFAISRAKYKVAFLYNTENRSQFIDEYLY